MTADATSPLRPALLGADADLPFVLPQPRQASYGGMRAWPGWRAEGLDADMGAFAAQALGPASSGGVALSITVGGAGRPGGYRLRVANGGVAIEAADQAGARHAVQSLAQLLARTDGSSSAATQVREADIDDWPGFSVRGLIGTLEVLRWAAPFKFNLLQAPGFRGPLQGTALDDVITESRALGADVLVHLGYKGSFDSVALRDREPGLADLEPVLDYYRDRQARGGRWFTVCFDDQPFPQGDGDQMGGRHVDACVAVRDALRQADPDCRIVFCGVPYAGDPDEFLFECELADGQAYLARVATLPDDVEVFWTGDNVFSPDMTGTAAARYGKAINRRPFIWDNDPCRWVTNLAPLSGRTADLAAESTGYVGNVGDPAYSMYVTPTIMPVLMTIADFTWNPEGYDADDALARSFRFLAGSRADTAVKAWDVARSPRVGTSLPATRAELVQLRADLTGLRHARFEDEIRSLLESF
jgi:hypothetical protein